MNYRHAYHAGNFADLVKHAALLRLLAELQKDRGPLTVIDTHAGRGLYDLSGPEAQASGEAEAGIVRLMAAADPPAEFAPLIREVSVLNDGPVRRYPGSPLLIARRLRPADRYIACELRPDDHAALSLALKPHGNARTLCMDGYRALAEQTPTAGRVMALIDPPFEKADDYARIVESLATLRARNARAQALVWLPLKDLQTLDGFLADLEDAVAAPVVVAECRMRPLSDPMAMNGCVLLMLGGPDLQAPLAAICGWVAQALGEGGAERVYRLPSP